jgi:protein-L-isoaspartate(D-aspartate) O-methyltransferase
MAALFILSAPASAVPPANPDDARAAMVERIRLKARSDYPKLAADPHFARVLAAVATTDRAAFVPPRASAAAYGDTPLPIGHGQTISDAYIVTAMTAAAALRPDANVLEIGTGSGYQAAILARLGARVHSVEIVAPLARAAARRLKRLGFARVAVRAGDGFAGWPAFAPYDAIIVTAGAAEIPAPLLAQLGPGGTLVMPIGPQWALEQLLVVRKSADGRLSRCTMGAALFVPLTGRGGRPDHPSGLYDRSIPDCY